MEDNLDMVGMHVKVRYRHLLRNIHSVDHEEKWDNVKADVKEIGWKHGR
jgi:hypothetical protein